MYKVEKFLKDLGGYIKSKIEQAENGGAIDADMLDEIEELCDGYNAVFKFAEHHFELKAGCLHKRYEELMGSADFVKK